MPSKSHIPLSSAALPEETPGGIRKREFVYFLAFLALGWMYLDRYSYQDQKVMEARDQEISRCQRIQAQHAKNLTTLLDRGGILYVQGEPVALCRKS